MKRFSALSAGMVATAITVAMGTASATAAGSLPTLSLTMTGKTITAPTTIAAGAVDVESAVSGEAAGAPTLVRLDPGVTFQQAFGQVQSHHGDPNALDGYGTIEFSTQADKGTSSAQTVLPAGDYVALDSAKNNPAQWPIANFTVTANPTPAALPAAATKVDMEEFAFTGPSTWHDGKIIRFTNIGYLYHMVIAFPVKNKATAKAVTTLLEAGKDNKAGHLIAGEPFGFVQTVGPGAVQQQVLDAKPGIYVLACFMDTQDGREHSALGMVKTIKVVK